MLAAARRMAVRAAPGLTRLAELEVRELTCDLMNACHRESLQLTCQHRSLFDRVAHSTSVSRPKICRFVAQPLMRPRLFPI